MKTDAPETTTAARAAEAPGYRSRSRAVRAAARSTLGGFRAERSARLTATRTQTDAEPPPRAAPEAGEATPLAASATPDPSDERPDRGRSQQAAEAPSDGAAAKPRRSVARKARRARGALRVASTSGDADAAPASAEPDELLVMTVSPAASAVARHAIGAAAKAPEDGGASDPRHAPDPAPPPVASDGRDPTVGAAPTEPRRAGAADPSAPATLDACDLDRLPGAGPGLVWLLHEAGIPDLAALAAADAADLAERLGLVGRLIDVGAWIAQARATGRDARPAGTADAQCASGSSTKSARGKNSRTKA